MIRYGNNITIDGLQFKTSFVVTNIPFVVCEASVVLDGNFQGDLTTCINYISSGFHGNGRRILCSHN